jgi:hypothetical protein
MIAAAQLVAAEGSLRVVCTDLEAASQRHAAAHRRLTTSFEGLPSVWTSPVATTVGRQAEGALQRVAPVSPGLGEAADAVRVLSTTARQLAVELQRYEAAEAAAGRELTDLRWRLSSADPTDVVALETIRAHEQQAQQRQRRATEGIQACTQQWQAACRRASARIGQVDSRLLGVAHDGGLLLTAQQAPGAQAGSSWWQELRDFLFGDVLSFWNGGGERYPVGATSAAAIRMARMSVWARSGAPAIAFPTLANGGLGGLLARIPGLGWVTHPVTQRILTRAGFLGGLFTGVTGGIDVWNHGNPITAFQTEGAGYTSDVGRTVFGFGTAGVATFAIVGLAAPPVLVAVTIGAGVVWIGSEVVKHWDEITAWVGNAWDSTTAFVSDTWSAGTEFVGDAWNSATDTVSGAWDSATDTVSGAWDSATDTVSGAWDSATDTLSNAPLVGGLFGS